MLSKVNVRHVYPAMPKVEIESQHFTSVKIAIYDRLHSHLYLFHTIREPLELSGVTLVPVKFSVYTTSGFVILHIINYSPPLYEI